MAVNNIDHNADSNVLEDIPSMSKEEVEQSYQRRLQKMAGMDTNPRKKSCFVITRVIQKSGVSDHTDQDSVDDQDETNTEELSSDIFDTSKQTDIDPDPSSEDTVQSIATEDLSKEVPAPSPQVADVTDSAPPVQPVSSNAVNTVKRSDSQIDQGSEEKIDNMQSLSRFKVVKIESSQPFRRGRWTCQDFLSPPTEKVPDAKPEKSNEEVGSGNSSAASSVHYVPGIDDPGKNPLVDGFQSLALDALGAPVSIAPSGKEVPQYHDFNNPVASQGLIPQVSNSTHSTHTIQSPPANPQAQPSSSQPAYDHNFESQPGHIHNVQDLAGQQQNFQPVQASKNGAPQAQSTPYSQALPNMSQTQMQSNAPEQPNTEYIPTSDYMPTQEYIQQPPAPGQPTQQQAPSAPATQAQPATQTQPPQQPPQPQNPSTQDYNPSATNQQSDYPAASSNSAPATVPEAAAGGQPAIANSHAEVGAAGGDFQQQQQQQQQQAAAASVAPTPSTTTEPKPEIPAQSDQGYPQAAEPRDKASTRTVEERINRTQSSSSLKGVGAQSLLTPPLLEMVTAMQPQGANDEESGASQVAIDNKIEQAMDLVKSHLMYAVREEVLVLKEQIQELRDKNSQLEYENNILKGAASQETLAKLAKGPPPPYTEPNPPPPASTS